MGSLNAQGMNEAVNDGLLDMRTALRWHLTSNHYPPIHPVFIDTAEEAIAAANAGDWDTEITMPNGIVKTVGSIVEELHLGSFLDADEDGDW